MKNAPQLQQRIIVNDSRSDAIDVTNRRDATRKSGSNCYGGNSSNH